MVPMRPFPGRLAPSSTLTNVPTRASCEFKRFASLSFAVWGQTDDTGGNTEPDPNRVPFPDQGIAGSYTFLCTPAHSVRWDTNTSFSLIACPANSDGRVDTRHVITVKLCVVSIINTTQELPSTYER
jgi:hypothetical protein